MKDNYSKEEIEKMRYVMEGESALAKIKRKCREEPFVPAGRVLVILEKKKTYILISSYKRCCIDLFRTCCSYSGYKNW